jgi:hypothetical protein
VVLHQNINSKRETCPGIPAVYLVEPTTENMKLIAGDCQRNLYDFVFITFTRKISDQEMDTFAIEMTKSNAAHKICRVGYEHLGSYHVISKDFFSLFNHQDNFINLYQGKTDCIDLLASQLFEFFCSIQMAPMIRVDSRETDNTNLKIIEKLQ